MKKIEEICAYFTEENAHICLSESNKEIGNYLIEQANTYKSFRARLNALSMKSQIFRKYLHAIKYDNL
jgi:hypothetical protein